MTTTLRSLLAESQREKVDLLNRLQAEDFRTFTALSANAGTLETPEYQLIPKTDQNELKVLKDAGGLGEAIYDDGSDSYGNDSEFRDTLAELGIVSDD